MKRFILVTAALGTLAACSDVKQTVGLGRNSPDEFNVVENPPLTLPPDFTLRPPDRGATGPKAEAAPAVAAKAVGAVPAGEIQVEDASSPGLAALLNQAKAAEAKPEIRADINKESDGVAVKDKSFVDKLMVWKNAKSLDPTVDAKAEAARVENAKSSGGFISGEGAKFNTPKPKAPLEGVFN